MTILWEDFKHEFIELNKSELLERYAEYLRDTVLGDDGFDLMATENWDECRGRSP